MNRKLDFYLEWLATAVCIVGALFTSLNHYPLGPILLNVGTLFWLIVSIMWKKHSLIVINAAILVIYTAGLMVQLLKTTH
jgi:hypothetical protein